MELYTEQFFAMFTSVQDLIEVGDRRYDAYFYFSYWYSQADALPTTTDNMIYEINSLKPIDALEFLVQSVFLEHSFEDGYHFYNFDGSEIWTSNKPESPVWVERITGMSYKQLAENLKKVYQVLVNTVADIADEYSDITLNIGDVFNNNFVNLPPEVAVDISAIVQDMINPKNENEYETNAKAYLDLQCVPYGGYYNI